MLQFTYIQNYREYERPLEEEEEEDYYDDTYNPYEGEEEWMNER